MDSLGQILANIQASSAGLIPILYGLTVAAGLDVLTGLWAAWNSGTLDGKFIPEFISSHLVKKIAPIFLVLVAGVSVGGTDSTAGLALIATGAASGAAYLASIVASISDNLRQGAAQIKSTPSTTTTTVLTLEPLASNAADVPTISDETVATNPPPPDSV